jgi:hypothetical protein
MAQLAPIQFQFTLTLMIGGLCIGVRTSESEEGRKRRAEFA